MREILSNRNNQPIIYTFGAYLALVLWALIFNRNDTQVLQIVNMLTPVCALVALVAAIWARFGINQSEASPEIWGRIVTGLVFWTTAEVIWAYAFLKNLGSPFTTAADALWLVGYVPFIEALTMRYQRFYNRPGANSILNVMIFVLALFIPLTYLALFPTIVGIQDWTQRIALLTKVSYSLAYSAILFFAFLVLITVGRGRLFKVWGMISLAFIFGSLVYFVFTYVFPGSFFAGRFATIPIIIHSLAHLFLALGIYGSWLLGQQIALVSQLKLGFIGKDKEIPQFLINTDVEGNILNVSKNFLQFTNNSLLERYLGKPVREVLSLSTDEFNSITDICSRGGFVINHDVKVSAGQKAPVPLLLTAVGALTSSDYFGLDIVLQLPNYSAEAYPLDPESNAITQNMLRRTGQQTKENSSYLTEYFTTYIASFYELIDEISSHYSASALAREINDTAIRNSWPIRVAGKEVNIEPGFDNFDNAELLKALPVLYQIAEQFTIKTTNAKTVAELTQKVDRTLHKNAILAAQNFGLRSR